MQKVKKKSFFRNLFVTFFVLMNVLLLTFSAMIFYQWGRGQKERNRQETRNRANLTVRILDEKFSTVDLLATQIASANWLKYASARSDILYSQLDYQREREICQTIGNQNDSLRIARSTAVLLAYRNLAVDRTSFWESERYFQSVGLDKGMLEEIQNQLEGRYGSLILYTNEALAADNGSFAVIRRLEYDESTDKILFVYIDGKQFSSFLKGVGNNLEGLEIRYEGEPVYTWGDTDGEETLFLAEIASEDKNWTYRMALREEETGITWKLGLLLAVLFLAVFALEFAASWYLASFSVRPVGFLMEKMGIRKTRKDSMLDDIEKSWQDLSSQKEWMETLGNQYYQIAESGYLTSLLFGTFDKKTAEEHAKKFRLPFSKDMYCQAMVFQYLGDAPKTFQEAMLKLQIRCYRDGVTAVYCKEEGVLLLAADGKAGGADSVARQEEQVRMTLDEIFPDLEIELHSGKVRRGFEGIAGSYRDGREKQQSQNSGQMTYYYPLEAELGMIHSLKLGNFERTEELLGEVRGENRERELLAGEERRVVSLIFEVFWRFVEDSGLKLPGLKEAFSRELEESRGEDLWDFLSGSLERIREAYRKSCGSRNLGKELVAYVDEHYTSSELSQQDIADVFQISRPMVSKVFKETTKMNFVDYLHRKRVELAKTYFDAGESNVIEVGRKAGYENEVTFRRAFLKCEGITPREYVKVWAAKK